VPTIDPAQTLTYSIGVQADSEGFAVNTTALTYDGFAGTVSQQEGTTIYALP